MQAKTRSLQSNFGLQKPGCSSGFQCDNDVIACYECSILNALASLYIYSRLAQVYTLTANAELYEGPSCCN